MLVASIPEQTLCVLGTSNGEEYLRSKDDLKIDFLRHCLQRYKEGKEMEENSNRMPECNNIKDSISGIEGEPLLACKRKTSRSSQASMTKCSNLQTVDDMGKRRQDGDSKTQQESTSNSKQYNEIDHACPDMKKRRKGDEGKRQADKSSQNAAIKKINPGLRSRRNVSIETARQVGTTYTTHVAITHRTDEVKVEPPEYDLQHKPPDVTSDKSDDSTEVMEADVDMLSRTDEIETSKGSQSTYVNKDTCSATQSKIDTYSCTRYRMLNEEVSGHTPSTNRNTEGDVGGTSTMDGIEDCVLTTRGDYGNVKEKLYTFQRETDLNGSIIVKASKAFKFDQVMCKGNSRIGSPNVEIYSRDKCFGTADDQKSTVNISGTSKGHTKEICKSKRLVKKVAKVDDNDKTRTVVLNNSFDGYTVIDTMDTLGVEDFGNSDSQSGKSSEEDDVIQDEEEADEPDKKNFSKRGKRKATPGKPLDPNLRTSVILEIISNGGDTKTGKTPLGVYSKVQKKLEIPALSTVTRLWQRFVTVGTLAPKKGTEPFPLWQAKNHALNYDKKDI